MNKHQFNFVYGKCWQGAERHAHAITKRFNYYRDNRYENKRYDHFEDTQFCSEKCKDAMRYWNMTGKVESKGVSVRFVLTMSILVLASLVLFKAF